MMETRIFKDCLETLAIYAEVRYHLQGGTVSVINAEASSKLDDLILNIITQLHKSAKGQIK